MPSVNFTGIFLFLVFCVFSGHFIQNVTDVVSEDHDQDWNITMPIATVLRNVTNGARNQTNLTDCDGLADLRIKRYWNPPQWFHHYSIFEDQFAQKTLLFLKEESVGRVISEDRKLEAEAICNKKLIKVTRFQRRQFNPVSIFSAKSPGAIWDEKESFYCASERGDCGAFWQLTMFPFLPAGAPEDLATDCFYPSNPAQLMMMHSGCGLGHGNGTTVCYIWKQFEKEASQ